jgi:dipeptidase D
LIVFYISRACTNPDAPYPGAKNIALDLVAGRTMLNLDTEKWGQICIGCAGGGDTSIQLDVPFAPTPTD